MILAFSLSLWQFLKVQIFYFKHISIKILPNGLTIFRRMGVDAGALHPFSHHEPKRYVERRTTGRKLDGELEAAKIRAEAGRVPLHLAGVNRSVLSHVFRHRRFPARESHTFQYFFPTRETRKNISHYSTCIPRLL
jgi:hypothetical protein